MNARPPSPLLPSPSPQGLTARAGRLLAAALLFSCSTAANKVYQNPLGQPSKTIADTGAFTCN